MALTDQFDEEVRNMRSGVDAAREWSEVAARIADALEHTVVMQAVGFMAMQGRIIDLEKLGRDMKHRTRCPGCLAARYSMPAPTLMRPPKIG